MMQAGSVASSIAAADLQAVYYALQNDLNLAWAAHQLIAILLPILLFFSGWGAAVYSWLLKRMRFWPLAAFSFFFSIAFAISIAQSVIVHRALAIKAEVDGSALPDLSTFFLSGLPGAAATAGGVALVGLLLCYVLRRKHRLTWLWLSVAATALAGMALMARPMFIPAQPLGDTPVERTIAAMAEQVGIPADRIAKWSCAGDSDCPPGQVVGLGPTRLILLDDRLTSKTPEDQLRQVFAHEAKHYLLDNNLKPVLLIFGICVAVLLVTQIASFAFMGRQVPRAERMADQAIAVPLVYGLGVAAYILLQPAIRTYRLHVEFEADRFGLEFNRDNQALIDIMRTDAEENPILVRYTPITRYFRATHPEIMARTKLAETYHPWLNGRPMVYARYFEK